MSSLTPHTDMVPVPRVEVVVDPGDLLPGTASITIRHRGDGREFFVRGAIDRSGVATVVAFDYEAPFRVEAVYEVLCFSSAGDYIGAVLIGSTTVECDLTVIQQPLDPKLNAVVRRLRATAETVSREARAELVDIEGEALPSLVGTGPRRGVSGLLLDLFVDSHEMADRLQATLGTYAQPQPQVWLVRTPPPMRIPRVLYCHVPALTEVEVNNHLGMSSIRFQATVTEVPQPAPGVSPAVLRYSDVEALYADYSDVEAVYTLYSDIQRDSSLIGAAG